MHIQHFPTINDTSFKMVLTVGRGCVWGHFLHPVACRNCLVTAWSWGCWGPLCSCPVSPPAAASGHVQSTCLCAFSVCVMIFLKIGVLLCEKIVCIDSTFVWVIIYPTHNEKCNLHIIFTTVEEVKRNLKSTVSHVTYFLMMFRSGWKERSL